MGIDLYVGTLSRYFCHDWETSQQQTWRAISGGEGPPMTVIAPGGAREPLRGEKARAVREIAVRYRGLMAQQLARHNLLESPPTAAPWNESHEAPYHTEGLNRYAYPALLLFAAYDHHPELMPSAFNVEQFHEDPALCASDDDLDGPYSHLLTGVTLWTPLRLTRPNICPHPNGTRWRVGSLTHLEAQLHRLNARTWKAPRETVEGWIQATPEASTEFESSAQQIFAMYSIQCRRAIESNVCMVLDV